MGIAFPLSLINTCYTVNDVGDIEDINHFMPQSWTGSKAGDSSNKGFMMGAEALNGLVNVILTSVLYCTVLY